MKQLRVLKHLFKHVQAFLIALEFWSEEREKPEEGFMQAMRLKTKLYVWKAFPFGNVLGISNQKFCLNGKCPWCQVWELPQKASSSRLVQNGSTLTKLELVTISSDKLNMLWPSFTLGSNMYLVFFLTLVNVIHYHEPKQVKLKFGTKTYTPASLLPAFLTFYQLLSRVDSLLLSATPLDTSLNLN